MLDKIAKQQKEELLTLMLKNELAELWLTKKIAETPEGIRASDKEIETMEEEEKDQYNKYLGYIEKLERVLEAKKDNLFNLEYLNKAVKNVKKYV